MKDVFSSYVLTALADVITGGSANDATPSIGVYRSAYALHEFMMECGVSFQVDGSRVPSVRDKLRELIFIDPTGADIVRMIEHVADPRAYISEPKKGVAVVNYLNKVLEADNGRSVVKYGRYLLWGGSRGGPP